MKRIILLLLVFSLVWSFAACDDGKDIQDNGSPNNNTETGEQSSSTEGDSSATGSGTGGNGCIELKGPHYDSYFFDDIGYDKYIVSSKETPAEYPERFVNFYKLWLRNVDEIELVGLEAFSNEYGDTGANMSRYRLDLKLVYRLYGNYSQNMSITVLHGELSEPSLTEEVKQAALASGALPKIYFREANPVITDHASNDLRYYGDSKTVDYFCNGIRYTYEKGNLTEIHWQSGDTKFWFTFDEPLYASTYFDWISGALDHPLLWRFLRKDQTSTAIAWFDEMIMTP